MIKANAYGHGAVDWRAPWQPRRMHSASPAAKEAMELRESGIDSPIVLLEGVFEPAEIANAAMRNSRWRCIPHSSTGCWRPARRARSTCG